MILIDFIKLHIRLVRLIITHPWKYTLNNLMALDQAFNAFYGGDHDETISSRLGRNYPNSRIAKIINFLFFWDKNHCVDAIEHDEGKNALMK